MKKSIINGINLFEDEEAKQLIEKMDPALFDAIIHEYYHREHEELKESKKVVIKESREWIERYCKVQALDTENINFSIEIDTEPDIPGLRFRFGNAYEAANKISALLREGIAEHFIELCDNLSGEIIFQIAKIEGAWGLCFIGTREEAAEWRKRNGILE